MQNIILTIVNFFNHLFNIITDVFTALTNFLLDLPVTIFEKALAFLVWLLNQADILCSGCFSNNALKVALQNSFNALPESITYCLSQSGITSALSVLVASTLIWSVIYTINAIRKLL